jgi:hypothetical protein
MLAQGVASDDTLHVGAVIRSDTLSEAPSAGVAAAGGYESRAACHVGDSLPPFLLGLWCN